MDTTVSAARQSTAFTVLVGLSALTVLLQGLWAGIFLEHDGRRDAASGWVEVHARGGEVALVFAAAATVGPSSGSGTAETCGSPASPSRCCWSWSPTSEA